MSTDEFGSRMYNDVCSVFDRTDQIRCSECVVDYKRKSMLVCNFSNRIDIRDITVRITKSFKIDGSCVILNCIFYFFQVMCIYKCSCDSVMCQCVFKKVEASTVDCLLRYDMSAICCKCFDGICNCSCSGCCCKSCHTTFKCCDSLFKYVLCRVCQTSVNVTCICKSESCCCMCRVLKYIRCCLVNRYCSGIRCRIWFFLSYVKLKCFKFIIAHIFLPLFSTV